MGSHETFISDKLSGNLTGEREGVFPGESILCLMTEELQPLPRKVFNVCVCIVAGGVGSPGEGENEIAFCIPTY